MTIETKTGEGSKTEGEGQKVDVAEVMKRLEQLQGSYDRVLEESKSNKSKAQEYRSKFEEAEKKKLEDSGDIAKLLDMERKTREEKEKEVKSLKNSILHQKIRESVSRHAGDVHDLDILVNLPELAPFLKSAIREDLTIDDSLVKDGVNKAKESKPFVFKHTQKAGVDSTRPNSNGTIKSANEIGDLKKGEHKEHLKNALSNW